MDYNYVYNIMDLYFKNEEDNQKTILNLTKTTDKVVLNFKMNNKNNDKTTFDLPLQIINNYIQSIIKRFKEDNLVIDEKYELDSQNRNCVYLVKFSNGRLLSFNNFSVIEINNIRNILYNITIRQEELRITNDDIDNIKMNYKPRLQETGFTKSSSLFLMVIFFADVFMISLWIFNLLIIK